MNAHLLWCWTHSASALQKMQNALVTSGLTPLGHIAEACQRQKLITVVKGPLNLPNLTRLGLA